jgi:nitrogen fixation/metabolism regulation signal transduction histidine kinase
LKNPSSDTWQKEKKSGDEMALFFVWTGLIALALSAYCLLVWRKNRLGSRFRARLTILFLLFVLVPVIPLNLFIANLLTQSADVLLLPGVGEALETSLGTIRNQLAERGRHFIETYRDPEVWSVELLKKEGVFSAGVFQWKRDSLITQRLFRLPDCGMSPAWKPPREWIREADSASYSSAMHMVNRRQVFTVCRKIRPVVFMAVCYPVPEFVLQSKDRITKALDVYNTLSLLKETIIQKNIIWALAVLLISGLAVLSIHVAKRLSREISEPIDYLVSGMQKVAIGDFDFSIQTQAKDEFRFLIDSFNRMVADLKNTRKQLIRAEKVAAWREIARQISHEIKNSLTPVTITFGRLRRQMERHSEWAEAKELFKTVEEEFSSLERMASEFSEFARLPQPDKKQIRLNEVVLTAIRMAESSFGAIAFQADLDPDLPPFDADPEQIKRVLNNLLKNAAEASKEGGRVRIATRSQAEPEKSILLEIRDNGRGMDAETLSKMFTPYFTTKTGGTGLGLAIIEKIIKDHDGDVSVQSGVGKGTAVTVRFRLK